MVVMALMAMATNWPPKKWYFLATFAQCSRTNTAVLAWTDVAKIPAALSFKCTAECKAALGRFLEDGNIEMSDIIVENGIRPKVVGFFTRFFNGVHLFNGVLYREISPTFTACAWCSCINGFWPFLSAHRSLRFSFTLHLRQCTRPLFF